MRLPLVLPPGVHHNLLDITPDGQELLFAVYPPIGDWDWLEAIPIWTVRISDGSSRRVGDLLARNARFSPDGRKIAFTAGGIRTPGTLWVASSDGSNPHKLLEVKDRETGVIVWAPDGTRIAFQQRNRASQQSSAWEISAEGKDLRQVAPDWRKTHFPIGWTPDGRLMVHSRCEYWTAAPRPIQLTSGEPCFASGFQQREQGSFYAPGLSPLGQLQRFDSHSRTWEPLLGGISASGVEYSRDGQRVAYVTHPQGELWIRHADGSQPIQLAKSPIYAFLPRWSPDGKRIAFMAKTSPDAHWRIHLVSAAGGTPRPACQKDQGPQGDLAWMPDGKKIVYGLPVSAFYSGEKLYLRTLDLETCEVSKFSGSDGLASPRWSWDGKKLLAVRSGATPMMLYDVATGRWEELKNTGERGWPAWSHDGSSIWYYDCKAAVLRYDLRTKRTEEVLRLNVTDVTGSMVPHWFNLTPNDEPMVLRRQDVVQIYAFEWKKP